MAVGLLVPAVPHAQLTDEVLLKQAVDLEKGKGDVKGAIELYRKLVASTNPRIATTAREELNRLLRPAGAAPSAQITERTIWSGSDVPGMFALSYDGRFAAQGDGALVVRDLTTGTDRTLVSPERTETTRGSAIFAAFSRDGRFIAYDWRIQNGTETIDQLRVVPADAPIGSVPEPRTLLVDRNTGGFSIRPGDWSPDGTLVAVIIGHPADRTRQIGVVDVKTGALRVLKTMEFRGSNRLVFSPDGQYLALDLPASTASAQRDVHVIEIATGRELPIVTGPDRDELAGWSRSGHLLFVSDRQGTNSLWAQQVTKGRAQGAAFLLRADVGVPVAVTSDGSFVHIFKASTPRIYLAPLDTTTGRLTAAAVAIRTRPASTLPAWSPDGKALATLSMAEGTVISVHDLESGRVREQLLPVLQIVDNLRWSPDGKSIVTSGIDAKSRRAVFLIDAQSLETRVAAEPRDGTRFVYPQWSTDGSSLYYLASTGTNTELVLHHISSGVSRTLLSRPYPPAAFGTLSPDEKSIATSNSDGSAVSVVALDSGEERVVSRAGPRTFLGGPAAEWTPDGQALLVRRSQGGNAWGLWLIPLNGDEPRAIDVGVPNLSGFVRLSSRGQLAFSAGVERREVRVVQGLPLPVR